MVPWHEFVAAAPGLAATGEDLLFQFGLGLAFLATIRKDGGPRLHPVCPVLSQGRLYVLIIPTSPKQQDLLRDGRYALQTFPQPKPDSAEFYLTGRADLIEQPSLRRAVLQDAKHKAHESERLFELKVERAMHTTWEGWGTAELRPIHSKWRVPEGQSEGREEVFPYPHLSRASHWSGRPTARTFWTVPEILSCGPLFTANVRRTIEAVPSRRKERGMLYIFGGLPGTGKSTLAQRLARAQQAVHLRIDTIEQSLREAGCLINGPEGYVVAYRLAADNLRLGLRVVADSVNPLQVTRAAWREVAMHAGVPFIEIEVICSSAAEHRARVETRATDIAGLRLPTWDEVVRRAYEPWDAAHLVIDTAGQTVERSVAALQRALTRR